jgi:hypothetical protein
MKCYIGIDNGVTGSIGILYGEHVSFGPTPTVIEQDYTKAAKQIKHIHVADLAPLLQQLNSKCQQILLVLERPFKTNDPDKFTATVSGVDAFATTRTIVEMLHIPYTVIDSKQWQKELLPEGTKGHKELKKASMDIGKRLFPAMESAIQKQKDADGLLIAEYARRMNW